MILLLILAVVATGVAATMFSAWMLMLAVGVAHADWLPMLPTVGFWPAFLICLLLEIASLPAVLAAASAS